MSFVVCVFNVFNILVGVSFVLHRSTFLFVGRLLSIVFKVWVEFLVCVKCSISCVYCVISISLESLLYLMCGSFFLCVSNVKFQVCLFCVSLEFDVCCI